MTYDLVIGDRAYSSWSLRGWLLFDAFGLPVRTHRGPALHRRTARPCCGDFAPARTAPTMRTPDGTVGPETIAIAEELATRHPEAGLWPADPAAAPWRASWPPRCTQAFTALRSHCPMNLRVSYTDCAPPRGRAGRSRRLKRSGPGRADNRRHGPWLAAPIRRRMPSLPRSPPASPPTTCRSGRGGWPMCTPIWRTRPSAAGARWGMVDGADQDPSTAATIPAAPGPARAPARPRGRRKRMPKTPPAPIPASPSPMCWNSTAAASAFATPSAATRPWPTPKPGLPSWLFTIRKPFALPVNHW
jgi:glutathione S-transferase